MGKYQVPKDKYENRAKYFLDNFNAICNKLDQASYTNAKIDNAWANAVAEFYFLLNDAYKNLRRIPIYHGTEPAKISALTAVAICTLQLLRPQNNDKLETLNDVMINPLFGIRCASDRLKINFKDLTFDVISEDKNFEIIDRLYRSFIGLRFECADSYFLALKTKNHNLGDEIEFNLSDEDIRILEDKISLFHFLQIAVNGPLISARPSDI